MMSLAWPWMLALGPLPWLIRRWASPAPEKATAALRVPHFRAMVDLQSVRKIGSLQSRSSMWFWFSIVMCMLLWLGA